MRIGVVGDTHNQLTNVNRIVELFRAASVERMGGRAGGRAGETLIFNPGECAGFMAGRNAVGVVDLCDLNAEPLKF